MDLINNQYRVIKQIENSNIAPRYLVRDLSDNQEKSLAIVNKEYIGTSLLDFYTDKYPVYRNLISPVLERSIDFGIVKKIDDKKNRSLQYYILSEYFETAGTVREILPIIDKSNALKLFVQACRAVYYLHTKNIFYKELNFETIMLGYNGAEYTLKLKDMALSELYKRNYWRPESNSLYFQSPEMMYQGNISIQADIYSLGIFLYCLCSKNPSPGKDFKTDFYKFKEEAKGSFAKKALPIIEQMTINNEYDSIVDIIVDINNSYWTDHKAFEVSEVQQLAFESKLVGRDKELQVIMDIFDRVSFGKESCRYVCVHGELGIGKSMFLKTLSSKLYSQNLNVYSAFRCDISGALTDIVSQIMDDYPEVDCRSCDFSNINSVIRYIYDCVKDKPSMFIIDDFEKLDEYTIEAFEKLVDINKKSMLVFSCRNGQQTQRLSELIVSKTKAGSLLNMELALLSSNASALLVKQIVGYNDLSAELPELCIPLQTAIRCLSRKPSSICT